MESSMCSSMRCNPFILAYTIVVEVVKLRHQAGRKVSQFAAKHKDRADEPAINNSLAAHTEHACWSIYPRNMFAPGLYAQPVVERCRRGHPCPRPHPCSCCSRSMCRGSRRAPLPAMRRRQLLCRWQFERSEAFLLSVPRQHVHTCLGRNKHQAVQAFNR